MFRNSRVSILGLCAAMGAAASLQSSDAAACGGLFCNSAQPVNQAAERIIFAQNEDGTVTAAIEVQYEGPSESFAWVLPVPDGEVDVGVSSKLALDRLDGTTNPTYQLQVVFDESCGQAGFGGVATGAPAPAADFDNAAEDPAASPPDVIVLEEGSAGPYDYQIISVNPDLDDSAQVAVDWLTENNYDIGELGPDVLRPYLDGGMNLVAFRLTKGSDAGSIRPIMITYESEQPFIPMRPTAVAANQDMGVKVWVLGNSRAIPENYLHLEINEALINWFNPNSNYNDVIIAAADEAGGHGFVTEQAGPAAGFADIIYNASDDALWEQLRTGQFDSMQTFMQTAVSYFGNHDGFLDVLRDDVTPLRDGATAEQFVACVNCYFQEDVAVRNEAYPSTDFDPNSDPLLDMNVPDFLSKLDELVISPLADTAALFENNSNVTRMYTTLSPNEMTVDPAFSFNPELEDVSNQHIATQTMMCVADGPGWLIDLPQGISIEGDGTVWPIDFDSGMPANLRVLQLSTSGGGVSIEDNAEEIGGLLIDLGVGEAKPELMDPPGPDPEDPMDVVEDPMDVVDDPMMDPADVLDPMEEDPVNPSDAPSNMQDDEADPAEDPAEGDGEPTPEDEPAPEGEEPMDDTPAEVAPEEENADEMSSEDGGCGCATVGNNTPVDGKWAWLGLVGMALLRRRRR